MLAHKIKIPITTYSFKMVLFQINFILDFLLKDIDFIYPPILVFKIYYKKSIVENFSFDKALNINNLGKFKDTPLFQLKFDINAPFYTIVDKINKFFYKYTVASPLKYIKKQKQLTDLGSDDYHFSLDMFIIEDNNKDFFKNYLYFLKSETDFLFYIFEVLKSFVFTLPKNIFLIIFNFWRFYFSGLKFLIICQDNAIFSYIYINNIYKIFFLSIQVWKTSKKDIKILPINF